MFVLLGKIFKLYWWSEDKNDNLLMVCAALTNYYVSKQP